MLEKYDRKFLELMHYLALNKKFMNVVEVSKSFARNKNISDRTVRRWFKAVQKYCFDYFPALRYGQLGLQWVSVIVENLRDSNFLKIMPYIP